MKFPDWCGSADADAGIGAAIDAIDAAQDHGITGSDPCVVAKGGRIGGVENGPGYDAGIGPNDRVIVASGVETPCTRADESICTASRVVEAGIQSEEGIAEARGVRHSCKTSEKGIERSLLVCLARPFTEESIEIARGVCRARAFTSKDILGPRATQDATAIEVVLRGRIDD